MSRNGRSAVRRGRAGFRLVFHLSKNSGGAGAGGISKASMQFQVTVVNIFLKESRNVKAES
jgi:hypothetical protein